MSDKRLDFVIGAKYAGTPAVNRLRKDLKGARNELNMTSVAGRKFSQQLGGSSWRRQVQQAGMQISDFSVQVAGGQSAILAFTQNAPQFIQNFGAMGGVIAAAVTILGTFWYSASRAAGAVKEFSKQVDDTKSELESYFALIRAGDGLEAKIFKEASKRSKKLRDDIRETKKAIADFSIKSLTESFANESSKRGFFGLGMTPELSNLLPTPTSGQYDEIRKYGEAVSALLGNFQKLSRESSEIAPKQALSRIVALREEFVRLAEAQNDSMNIDQLGFIGKLDETREQLELLIASEVTAGDMRAKLWADAKQKAREYYTRVAIFAQDAHKAQIEAQRETNRQIELGMQAGRAMAATMSTQVMGSFVKTFKQAQRLRAELGDSAFEALRLAGVDIENGVDAAAKAAARLAAELNVSLQLALQMQSMGVEVVQRARVRQGMASGAIPPQAGQDVLSETEKMRRDAVNEAVKTRDRIRAIVEAQSKSNRKRSGGGGGSKGQSDLEKFTERAREAYDETKRLTRGVLGIDDAWARFREGLTDSKDIEGFTDQFIEKAREIKTTFEQMRDTISQSMMGAFKGLLAGTKSLGEAARDILGSILERVIDLLMTPVFNSIAGGLAGGIFGGLGKMGAGVMGFEGGGHTGPGPRAGGVDGRGGRLAVVHPNESIYDHTRGQSAGGGTVINMTVVTPNAESFQASKRQIQRRFQTAMG